MGQKEQKKKYRKQKIRKIMRPSTEKRAAQLQKKKENEKSKLKIAIDY